MYPHARNALSVVVGPMPSQPSDPTAEDTIAEFLRANPLFARKFEYDNMKWACYENKDKLIAAFRFKGKGYRFRLPAD